MPTYSSHDPFPYPADPNRRLVNKTLPDGLYAYAQALSGEIWVVQDRPHVHPKILGGGAPARYAGDLSIQGGEVIDVTNLSGTFQCDDPAGLLAIADQLRHQGLGVRSGAVRFFPAVGSPPRVLA